MFTPIRNSLLLLAAGLCAAPAFAADPLSDACDQVMRQLRRVPADRLVREPAQGGAAGCHITLDSRWPKLTAPHLHPDTQLSVEEGKPLARAGWTRDSREDADGPDGTRYTLVKGPVRCQVTGSWDGGDDSDASYVPSDKFTYVVDCR